MLASRMLPPVGFGTVPNSGHTKHSRRMTAIMAPGITRSSERVQPRRNALGSAGGAIARVGFGLRQLGGHT